ncbi:hypothetical protein ACTPEF_25745, partial [Clostridioides difficile]
RESNNPWAYVSNNSYLALSTKENETLSFENYPYPFVRDDEFNHSYEDKGVVCNYEKIYFNTTVFDKDTYKIKCRI